MDLHTLQITVLPQTWSLPCLHRSLPGNGSQQWRFLRFRTQVLIGWRLSPNSSWPPLVRSKSKSKSNLRYDRRSVGHSVLMSSPNFGLDTRFLLLSDTWRFVDMGRPFHKRTGLSFANAAGPRQRSHSRVCVPRESWPSFIVSDLRLHQPGGPGPRIHIYQEQGCPITLPGTGFHFHRLLRHAGLRCRYSDPPPYGLTGLFTVKIKDNLRLSVYRQSVHLAIKPLETHNQRPLFFNWTLAVIVLM
jgi:hypothetical protein